MLADGYALLICFPDDEMCIRDRGIAVGDGGLDLLLLDRALVVDREGNLTGLLQDAVGDLVAATRLDVYKRQVGT